MVFFVVVLQGKNYLIPIDGGEDPEYDCVCLDDILRRLNQEAENLFYIIILDACRADENNPTWKTKDPKADPLPAFGKALSSHVRMPKNSQYALIFSSDPGTVSFANDTTSGNSFFTAALLNHINRDKMVLEQMMKQVIREIREKTADRQRPWINSCTHEDFFFKNGGKYTIFRIKHSRNMFSVETND
jgi:uncharacterized caspase-like protein